MKLLLLLAAILLLGISCHAQNSYYSQTTNSTATIAGPIIITNSVVTMSFTNGCFRYRAEIKYIPCSSPRRDPVVKIQQTEDLIHRAVGDVEVWGDIGQAGYYSIGTYGVYGGPGVISV